MLTSLLKTRPNVKKTHRLRSEQQSWDKDHRCSLRPRQTAATRQRPNLRSI